MKQSIKIGKISNIPVYVHWSFPLIILYFVYHGWQEGLDAAGLAWLVGFVLVLFTCVLLHELGHSLSARRYGIDTEDITLLPIGGLARLQGMPKKPIQEIVVALMGPMVNVVIALLLILFFWLSPYPFLEPLNELENAGGLNINQANFLPLLLLTNIGLVLFNCVPAFPMDGGRVFRALLSIPMNRVKATRIASYVGQAFAVGFAIFSFMGESSPFLMLIAVFIFIAAASEYRMVKTEDALTGRTVRDVMRTQFTELSEESSINDVHAQISNSKESGFLVTGRLSEYERVVVGFIGKKVVRKALKSKKGELPVRTIMSNNIYHVSPDADLKRVYDRMTHYRILIMPVYENEILIGAIGYYQIRDFIG